MSKFNKIMKQRTNAELLEITTILRDDYQEEALIAAENELKLRKLSENELTFANDELEKKKKAKELKIEKNKKIEGKIEDITNTFNPLSENTTNKIVKAITIGLGIPYLIYFISNWELSMLFLQSYAYWDISLLGYFAPIILFPIGLYGFWLKKSYGWTIITILLTLLTTSSIFSIMLSIKWSTKETLSIDPDGLLSVEPMAHSPLEELLAGGSISYTIIEIITLGAVLIFINRPRITNEFVITKRRQLLAIGLTAVPISLLWLTLLLL